jgi:7-cyano-7-deazaguanine synthase
MGMTQPATSPQPEPSRSSPTSRAVVCLSGGMDSAVCAAIAALQHETYALHFSYGQRTEQRELHSARAIANELKLAKFLPLSIDIFRIIGGSALTDSSIAVPQQAEDAPGSGPDPDAIGASIPVTYVPFRNAHFLSSAVSWAEVLGAEAIYIGAVEQDSSGYPDCRPAYYEAFQQLIRTGTRHGSIRLETPLISMRKQEIVRRGLELRAPFHVTWSCYTGSQTACGTCESCILRLRAFAEAGIDDPIPYATDWRQTANAPGNSI